ncbi:LptF/LptG family permease [Lacibacterium aquatile]|uniref:LptF/LptG family permease n=1 Tax=Lacibacterium aquatile TaxID=1168082 RepID=A0ABW5DXS9_9PROT
MTIEVDNPRRRSDGWSILRLDRYIFAATARPFAITLGVVLISLLLERVLRLFDLLAQTGISMPVIVELAANLVPHYLGLAMPMAFFIAVFTVIGRLDDNNELDAMMASGLSISRITRPFLMIAVLATGVSLLLFGFVQPYSRYAYRALLDTASNAIWDGRTQAATFVDTPKGIVLSADGVDPSGTRLTGVFLREKLPNGGERITTANVGELFLGEKTGEMTLVMERGQTIVDKPGEPLQMTRFESLLASVSYADERPPFRLRGEDERELTLIELAAGMRDPAASKVSYAEMAAELYGRLARSLSLPLLPLLAIPLAMVSKRGRRGAGLVLAGLILFAYQHALQFGTSLAEARRVAAFPAVWTPFAIFAALCLWLFLSSRQRPGDNPLTRITSLIDLAIGGLLRFLPKRKPRP